MAYQLLMRSLDRKGGEFRGGADAVLWAAFAKARDLTTAESIKPKENAAAFAKLTATDGSRPSMRYARSLLIDAWTAEARARPNAGPGVVSTFFLCVYNATLAGLGYGAGSTSGVLNAPAPVHARDLERLLKRLRGATAPGLSALHSLAFEPDAQLLSVADPQLAAKAFKRISAPEWWATPDTVKHWSLRAEGLVRALVDLMAYARMMPPDNNVDPLGVEEVDFVNSQQDVWLAGSKQQKLYDLARVMKHSSQWAALRKDPQALIATFGLISKWAAIEYNAIHNDNPSLDAIDAHKAVEKQYSGVLYYEFVAVFFMIEPRPGTKKLAEAHNVNDMMNELHSLAPRLEGAAVPSPPPAPKSSKSPYPWILKYLLHSPLALTRGAMLLVLNSFGDTVALTDAAEEAYIDQMWPRTKESERAWALEHAKLFS